MEEIDYKKKILTCEKLGAKRFQKFVLSFEKIRWKFSKKKSKHLAKWDKLIEKNRKKNLKKNIDEKEIKIIKKGAILQKLALREEYNKSNNLNYHISKDRPSEFLDYLYYNKYVHQKNLIWNSILFPISVFLAMAGIKILILLSIYQVLSAYKNFQCVNLQNYNIYRIKRIEEKLKDKEDKKEKFEVEKFHIGEEIINKKLEEKNDIIKIDEVLENIENVDQLKQLKYFLINKQEQRVTNKIDNIHKGGI